MSVEARIALLLAGLALGCGSGSQEPQVAAAPPQPAPSAPAALPPLAPGGFRVSVEGDRIDLEAVAAERGAVLAELQRQVGFGLLSDPPLAPLRLDLRFEAQSLPAVLSGLLPGREFRIDYRYDPGTHSHKVARVLVGPAADASPAAATPPVAAASPEASQPAGSVPPVPSDAERERLRAEREARETAARERLYSEDPSVRAAAIEDVYIDGPARDRIFALAADDPDPQVRAAAVKLLGEEESTAAMDALYAALKDPAPQVVMESLAWIEAEGDASSIPYLTSLIANSPDARVRDRAYWVRDFLED